jgi:hypothetical protein
MFEEAHVLAMLAVIILGVTALAEAWSTSTTPESTEVDALVDA